MAMLLMPQDYDLWRHAEPQTRAICRRVSSESSQCKSHHSG